MIIRKKFKTEGPAHIVRNCSTAKCAKSIHGHSYVWEVKFEGMALDNGGMIVDFSLMKDEIGRFFDLLDHSHMQWDKDTETLFFEKYSERYVRVPFTPSAENLALFALKVVTRIVKNTLYANNEKNFDVYSVTCHETETGCAEAFIKDLPIALYSLDNVFFKHGGYFWDNLLKNKLYVKIKREQQICIK